MNSITDERKDREEKEKGEKGQDKRKLNTVKYRYNKI